MIIKNKEQMTEEILKKLQTDIVFTPIFSIGKPIGNRALERADYIHHFEDNIIPKAIHFTKKKTIKEVLKLIKAWDGYGDDRFPEGELKELIREIKKL